jgi:hypothetical protein
MKIYAVIAALFLSANANGGGLHACEVRTAAAYPAYEQTPGADPRPGPDFHQSKTNSIARGDYDGDGVTDIALLLRPKSGSGKYAISACLTSKPTALPELIRDAYTTGDLTTTPRGQKYYDFDDGTEGEYELDGVGTSCCECCGATYIFRSGRFVEIVDSD